MLLENKRTVIYGGGGAIGGGGRPDLRPRGRVFLAGRALSRLDDVARDVTAAEGVAEAAEVDALDEKAINEHADAVAAKILEESEPCRSLLDAAPTATGAVELRHGARANDTTGEFRCPTRLYAGRKEELRAWSYLLTALLPV